ncbi:hypothetical protein HMSSN036_51640 [Paenibacillus macerans]|nr:hypothetical protein HMSSN036_51640 [Paenibacillus macerans]
MKEIYFAENLKRFREARGMTKEELGNRVGVSGAMVGYWEKKTNEPRMGKVQLIANILDVDLDELLFSEPPKYKENIVPNFDRLTELQQRAINAALALPDEELELIVPLMERGLDK